MAAADAAYDWIIREKKIPGEQIVVLGKSLGGGPATDLASRRSCRALVLVMTFTSTADVAQRLLPFVPCGLLMRDRFDNLAKIGRVRCPVYLAHGSEDWKIPAAHSEWPAKVHFSTRVGEQAASEATVSASGCFKNRSRRVSFDEARRSQFPTRKRRNPGCRTTATAAL